MIGDFFISLINAIIAGIGAVLSLVLEIFPDTPFGSAAAPPELVDLSWVTWIFDFPTWIQHFTLLLSAIAALYLVRVAARWIKLLK